MRKKPFLSRYENILEKSKHELTVGTESGGENSDEDEYSVDGTILTESTETSDEDEFYADKTVVTRMLESDDEDLYIIGSSIITESTEDSDVDDLVLD